MTLRMAILGPLVASRAGVPVDLGSTRQRCVLASLVLAEGRPVRIQELAGTLWGEEVPASAVNVVQTYVKRLRHALEPDRASRASSPLLPRVGDGYALDPGLVEVDVARFRELAAHPAGYDQVARALALWRGEPLAELPLLAGHPRLTSLAGELVDALGRFAGVAVREGRAADLLPFAEDIARMLPLDERVHSVLIRLCLEGGRRTDALLHYREISRRLERELGVRPGPELTAVHATALHDEPAAPPGPARLPAPAQLPPDISDFSGRLEQVSALTRMLGPGERTAMPLVVITGMGGVGKTTLAVHAGHRLRESHPDGQLYVDLHGTDGNAVDPASVLNRMLLALGVDGSVIPAELDERATLYRSRLAGRRVLVVLDNALDEAQVRPLLPGAPTCATIVTSRSRLRGLSGGHHVDLDVFHPQEALDLLIHLVGESRVRTDQATARAIVEACGHIPLAVRVTGARIAAQPRLSLGRFHRELGDERRRLDQLAAGDLAVRASFRLSYASLPAAARRGFRLLGLLDVPDFADWVLATLLDAPPGETAKILDLLVDAHLVTVAGEDETGESRYRMHDLIRLYARERTEAEDSAEDRRAARRRAFATWLALAEDADRLLAYRTLLPLQGEAPRRRLPGGRAEAMLADPVRWFQSERANLAAAIAQCADDGHPDLCWNLAEACVGFYEMRDLLTEWRAVHTVALSACEPEPRGRAVLARSLAYLSCLPVVRPQVMREHAELSLRLFREVGDRHGEVDAQVLLGTALVAGGLGEEGLEQLRRAEALAVTLGHDAELDFLHSALGFIYREQGKLELASHHLERVLERTEGRRLSRLRLMALRSLGMVRFYQGRTEESRHLLLEMLRLARLLGVRVKELLALLVLGESGVLLGRPDAAGYLDQAEALATDMGGEFALALVRRGKATRDLLEGHAGQARDALLVALEVFRGHGVLHLQAMVLKALGHAHALLGESGAALAAWREAESLFRRMGNLSEAGELAKLGESVSGPG
ncbi:BTAD domain-containing putative transcriptional regulator [Nonomuraea sp. NPDC023979]|uniref:AfsR/SARP family transcriptional regulator n=1 Tax=Nonomuraea sp. NPDC023979 TaxID=3154796 RepID=UPI0033F6E12E